jgi:hypothetical protein
VISYVDKEKNELILVGPCEYVYSIPIQGDWVISARAIQEGTKTCLPGVNVLGLQVELPRILSSRGISIRSFKS